MFTVGVGHINIDAIQVYCLRWLQQNTKDIVITLDGMTLEIMVENMVMKSGVGNLLGIH